MGSKDSTSPLWPDKEANEDIKQSYINTLPSEKPKLVNSEMVDTIKHRFHDYLRAGESMNAVDRIPSDLGAVYKINPIQSLKLPDGQHEEGVTGDQRRERRSGLTSFADLYERAVKNVLNIKPLFDTADETFAARVNELNTLRLHRERAENSGGRQSVFFPKQFQYLAHSSSSSFSGQSPVRETVHSPLVKSEPKSPNDLLLHSPPYLSPQRRNFTSNGFFSQLLSEQSCQNNVKTHFYPRHTSILYPYQNALGREDTRYSPARVQKQTNRFTFHNILQSDKSASSLSVKENNLHKDVKAEPNENHTGKSFANSLPNKRNTLSHDKGTLLSHLKDESGMKKLKMLQNDSAKSERRDSSVSSEILDKEKSRRKPEETNGCKSDSELSCGKSKVKEHHHKLKYRPYSLRSKRNRLPFKLGRRALAAKLEKAKKQKKLDWVANTPQEKFLVNLGLMSVNGLKNKS